MSKIVFERRYSVVQTQQLQQLQHFLQKISLAAAAAANDKIGNKFPVETFNV